MTTLERPVAVFYEHPQCLRFLFEELKAAGIDLVLLQIIAIQ